MIGIALCKTKCEHSYNARFYTVIEQEKTETTQMALATKRMEQLTLSTRERSDGTKTPLRKNAREAEAEYPQRGDVCIKHALTQVEDQAQQNKYGCFRK